MEPTPEEVTHQALDALLFVVDKASTDLRTFHDAVAKAKLSPLPRFPRTTVIITERIIDDLKRIDVELRGVLVALGVTKH